VAYKAEIAVDVRGLKDVKTLETSLNKISGKIGVINKLSAGNSKAVRVEKQVLNSKAAQADMMSKTRRIGDLVQKQADKGLKVGLAQEAISKSALLNSKKEFVESKRLQKVALDELKIQKAISKEIGQQAALKGKAGGSLAGGPFVSTGVASSRFGSVGQPGSPKFIASRAGAIQGPADPPFAPGMFPSSPIGGSKFMFGSPAQQAFSGGPSSSIRGSKTTFGSPAFFDAGARAGGASSPLLGSKTTFGSPKFFDAAAKAGGPSSPILGSKTTFGSPKFLEASAKIGGPSIPVKGAKDIYGSPAYYAATNKEAKRVAKANAVPIKGFKDLPGSPAYFEEQAKNAKSSALNFDKRTGKLLRGPAGSGGGGFRNLARRFDRSSALISGGFPLLFGQGPAVAAAGALGGGVGGMFGQMGGFAGGIAATAAVQAIQSALDEISKLGQAMGSFTQDTQAMITAMGLQGSAQEAQLKRIERTQGKTAAFNASMKMMENRIGTSGVRKIKEFGETTRVLGTIFSTTLLRLQAFMGGMANFIARLLAGEKQLKDAEVNQTIKDAAAGGNIEAQKLLDREREIEETGFDIKGRNRTKVAKFGTKEKLEELDRDKELFAVRQKVSLSNDEILSKSQDLVKTKTEELDLQNRIKEEMAKGTNKELATSLAKINQIFDKEQEILQSKVDQSNLDIKNAEKDGITGDKLQRIKDIHEANTQELEKHNKLRGEAIKLEKDLALATDSLKTNFEIIGESIASGVSDNLTAAIQGTKTLGDAAKSILNDLSSSLIRLGVNTLLSKIPGFGGLPILGTRSKGGPVRTGGSFIVGEKGPELFVPKRSGTIIPNDKLAGGGSTNISVNVDASGSSVQSNEQQGKELGRVISAAIQSELIKQRRPGGLLR